MLFNCCVNGTGKCAPPIVPLTEPPTCLHRCQLCPHQPFERKTVRKKHNLLSSKHSGDLATLKSNALLSLIINSNATSSTSGSSERTTVWNVFFTDLRDVLLREGVHADVKYHTQHIPLTQKILTDRPLPKYVTVLSELNTATAGVTGALELSSNRHTKESCSE